MRTFGVPSFLCRLLILASVATGCGSSADQPDNELIPGQTLELVSPSGRAKGHVRADGAGIMEGNNTLLVDFEPASTELVTVSALMPVHGHGIAPPNVSKTATGYRVSDVTFSMPGLWDVFLDVRLDGKTDRIEFTVDVP
ncbi:MAG TPA: hypothetical protein VF395_18275 [Polyangiaceae bacterium]